MKKEEMLINAAYTKTRLIHRETGSRSRDAAIRLTMSLEDMRYVLFWGGGLSKEEKFHAAVYKCQL